MVQGRLDVTTAERVEDEDTADLVVRIQAGEREAFADLYRRYVDRVYAYLRLLLNDEHEAEDVTQQVFLTLIQALPAYEHRRQPFRAWLFIVARNHAFKHLRKHGRIDPEDPGLLERHQERNTDPGAELSPLTWISDQQLVMLIERLPIPQRQALLLRHMLDLPNQQIATIMDRKPAEIKLLHHRALRFLEKRLRALGRTPEKRQTVQWRTQRKHAPVLRSRRFTLQ